MALSGRFLGWTTTIGVQVKGLLAEQSKKLVVKTAMDAVRRVEVEQTARSGGVTPTYRQVVDGKVGAPFSDVLPDGTIVLNWYYVREAARDTLHALVARSPVDSGDYVDSITMTADGVTIEDVNQIGTDAKVVNILPTVPYSRKLEVGLRKDGTPFSVQVPPHIVEETTYTMRKIWGDVCVIDFNYVDIADPYKLKDARGWRRQYGRMVTHTRYPAIFIKPRSI